MLHIPSDHYVTNVTYTGKQQQHVEFVSLKEGSEGSVDEAAFTYIEAGGGYMEANENYDSNPFKAVQVSYSKVFLCTVVWREISRREFLQT